MTAKEKVSNINPNASAWQATDSEWWITDCGTSAIDLGHGETEEAAWQNAAESLPAQPDLAELLKHAKPATEEELRLQRESYAANYKPGPRQCVPFAPIESLHVEAKEKPCSATPDGKCLATKDDTIDCCAPDCLAETKPTLSTPSEREVLTEVDWRGARMVEESKGATRMSTECKHEKLDRHSCTELYGGNVVTEVWYQCQQCGDTFPEGEPGLEERVI